MIKNHLHHTTKDWTLNYGDQCFGIMRAGHGGRWIIAEYVVEGFMNPMAEHEQLRKIEDGAIVRMKGGMQYSSTSVRATRKDAQDEADRRNNATPATRGMRPQ